MFTSLMDILKDHGQSILAYRKCSEAAFRLAVQDPKHAAACLVLGTAAQDFVDTFERMPLSQAIVREEFLRFGQYLTTLQAAHASGILQDEITALNDVATAIIQHRSRAHDA